MLLHLSAHVLLLFQRRRPQLLGSSLHRRQRRPAISLFFLPLSFDIGALLHHLDIAIQLGRFALASHFVVVGRPSLMSRGVQRGKPRGAGGEGNKQ